MRRRMLKQADRFQSVLATVECSTRSDLPSGMHIVVPRPPGRTRRLGEVALQAQYNLIQSALKLDVPRLLVAPVKSATAGAGACLLLATARVLHVGHITRMARPLWSVGRSVARLPAATRGNTRRSKPRPDRRSKRVVVLPTSVVWVGCRCSSPPDEMPVAEPDRRRRRCLG